jgi:hypothetical protein
VVPKKNKKCKMQCNVGMYCIYSKRIKKSSTKIETSIYITT